MPEPLNLSLGGIAISLAPDHASGEYALINRSNEFLTSVHPKVTLRIHCGWFPELNHEQVFFETDHAWQLIKSDGNWGIRVRSPVQDPYQLGIFPGDFGSGDIYVAPHEGTADQYVFPLSYPMGELYMMNLLGTGLGVLFHAAGVIYHDEGYLFTGHGGAGKTTTARLWQELPEGRVVNDDKVIIRKETGGFRLYGTPWHGDGGMALPDSAPLKRVYILKQADHNYAAPLQPAQAVSMLLARTFVPLWDAGKIAFTLKFLDELCQGVACQELGFLPDSSAVDFVRNSA